MPFPNESKITMIVGLGNPGDEYSATRHNAGFMVIDKLIEELKGPEEYISAYESFIWERKYRGRKVYLQKPLTYMNKSGMAVAPFLRKHQVDPDQLLVIYDDLDLPLGRIRLRKSGSSGGHNGIKSIIENVQSEKFHRLRIGIGRQDNRRSQVDHVLGNFSEDEEDTWQEVANLARDAVKAILFRGFTQAMNTYNGKTIEINKEK